MDEHKTQNASVCLFLSQSEASGGVSGPEGKHQGEACWLRLPQSVQEIPQQVNDSLHLQLLEFFLVYQETIGAVLFSKITWNLMWEKMSES